MTALCVFLALVVVSAAYSVYDARNCETNRQVEAFFRAENKRCYAERF